MSSIREQILTAFFERLHTLESDSVTLARNPDKAQKVPDGGAVITMHDGASGDPEMLLSPLTYIYEHQARLEIIINTAFAEDQEPSLDELLSGIGALIEADRTLGGLAEWVEAQAPEFLQEAIEGAPAMRAATVTVLLRFHTGNPLS